MLPAGVIRDSQLLVLEKKKGLLLTTGGMLHGEWSWVMMAVKICI